MESAFPRQVELFPDGSARSFGEYGMTLRDWFAGQALASYSDWSTLSKQYYVVEAKSIYEMADAMLEARIK